MELYSPAEAINAHISTTIHKYEPISYFYYTSTAQAMYARSNIEVTINYDSSL